MEMRNYLIAGGNSTLLVWGCLSNQKNIIQPTGETITVKIKGTKFTVGAKVVKIGESYEQD